MTAPTHVFIYVYKTTRGRSRTAATFKMERFVVIVNGWKPLTIITKRSIFDVAAALDPPPTTYPASHSIHLKIRRTYRVLTCLPILVLTDDLCPRNKI